jgi:hypothetical protein
MTLTIAIQYYCDGCNVAVQYSSMLYGCRSCNFDACGNCASEAVIEQTKTGQMRCPNGHGMIDMRWRDTRVCNGCSRHLEPEGKRFVSCAACDYDMCYKCTGTKQPTFYDILEVNQTASLDEIQRAAWKLSLRYRRQAVKNPKSDSIRSDAIRRFNEVATSFSVLSDEALREEYDRMLAKGDVDEDFPFQPRATAEAANTDDAFPWLRPPGFRRKQDAPPSIAHGTYVAVCGAAYAPVVACALGVATVCLGVVQGARVVIRGASRGASGVSRGVQQLVFKKSPKGTSTKIFINENLPAWQRSRSTASKPWRNVRKGDGSYHWRCRGRLSRCGLLCFWGGRGGRRNSCWGHFECRYRHPRGSTGSES